MIRHVQPEDYGYIVKTWVRSYASSPFALAVGPAHEAKAFERPDGGVRWSAGRTYQAGHYELVNKLLREETALVAEDSTDEGPVLVGFVVGEPARRVLHYVFVRELERGKGVARALVGELLGPGPVTFTHQTQLVRPERLPQGWRFTAYPLMGAA